MTDSKVTVEQADSAAATDVLDTLLVATDPVMLSPDDAETLIHQAFARHRIAATAPLKERIAELEGGVKDAEQERAAIVEWLRFSLDDWPDYVAPSDLAEAIEALAHLKDTDNG